MRKKGPKEKVKVVVISDIHFGSCVSQAKLLEDTLKQFEFEYLVMNGDIFEDLNLEKVTQGQWRTIGFIGKLIRQGVTVVSIRGNHDWSMVHMNALGIKWRKQFVLRHRYEGRPATYGFLHGHQFDSFWMTWRWFGTVVTWVFNSIIQPLDRHFIIGRWLKKSSKTWLRLSEQVADGAIRYAARRHWDVVMCGHTHHAYKKEDARSGIVYYNDGSWTEKPCGLITIDHDGYVRQHVIEESPTS